MWVCAVGWKLSVGNERAAELNCYTELHAMMCAVNPNQKPKDYIWPRNSNWDSNGFIYDFNETSIYNWNINPAVFYDLCHFVIAERKNQARARRKSIAKCYSPRFNARSFKSASNQPSILYFPFKLVYCFSRTTLAAASVLRSPPPQVGEQPTMLQQPIRDNPARKPDFLYPHPAPLPPIINENKNAAPQNSVT